MQPRLKVFVGYESRQDLAWQVARHSLLRHAKIDVSVYPVKQDLLREIGLYNREVDKLGSTEFTITRFLSPFLAATDDWCVFVDCDVLFTRDIGEVLQTLDKSKAVYVVQHAYEPRQDSKILGEIQYTYPRKNWSSLIFFNGANEHVRSLTPDLVNTASPAFLHRFHWVPDDQLIGALPEDWNYLVGDYVTPDQVPAMIHFTNGGPWFERHRDVAFADLWRAEAALLDV